LYIFFSSSINGKGNPNFSKTLRENCALLCQKPCSYSD
jgi:hypothetical protein